MRLCAALLSMLILTAASAPKYKGKWKTYPSTLSVEALVFEKNKFQRIARVAPARLFELSGDSVVAKGPIGYLGRGTLMVPVDESLRRFCRFERHLGSAFGCLSDSDGDGRLESYFGTQVFKEFFTGSVGDDGGHESLATSVPVVEVDSFLESPQIDLEFVYLGKSKKDEVRYQFCLSKKITDNIKFYQSRSRTGYSVVCSMEFRANLTKTAGKIDGFGVEIEIAGADAKTAGAKISARTNNTFETSSSFR